MRSFKSLLLLLLCSFLATGLFAQQAKLNKAKKLMDDYNYQGAVEVYLQILDKNDDPEAKINIAECYRMLRNPSEMEYWYGQVALLPQAPPINLLYYAQALQMNGKCDKALDWVARYLDIDPSNTVALFLQKACEESTIANLKASGALYDVKACKELNSAGDDFGPTLYKEEGKEHLMYVSTRAMVKGTIPTRIIRDNWTNEGFAQLWDSEMNLVDEKTYTYKYSDPKAQTKKIKNTPYHLGPISFSPDGSQAYFSATDLDNKAESDDGSLRLKIYKIDKKGKSWTEPKGVVFNDEEYNVTHPSLSADGTMLFFSSDMPGGFGGMDLYVSYMEDGRWSIPVNLGPTINTEGDEAFPYISGEGASAVLYFSSNGHIGLGGFDLYMSKENYGTWMEPTNLGFPVNSNYDDLSITMNADRTHGYFSSNRNGLSSEPNSGGDDIFSFTKLSVSIEVLVFDKKTEMPIEGAEVYTACTAVESYTTNPDGKVLLEVGLDRPCDFAAEKVGYRPNNVRADYALLQNLKPGETIVIQIPLDLERVFDVGGTVKDGYSQMPLKDALVRLKSDCEGEINELSALTDEEGYYEFLEIKEDCDYQIIVSKDGYTKASSTFTTKKTETDAILIDLAINCLPGTADCPNNPCPPGTTPSGHKDENGLNECLGDDGKRYYTDDNGDIKYIVDENGDTLLVNPWDKGVPRVVNIYYDFDRANIRIDAQPSLDSLVVLMKRFPEATVKFTSHTDARGTKGYNKGLSRRRAESVVRYLISNGVNKKRLRAQGMGEEVMINDCYDGIPCDETQHQENRRTEFVVINWDGSGKELKSMKPSNIIVDPCRNCQEAPKVEEGAINNDDTTSNFDNEEN